MARFSRVFTVVPSILLLLLAVSCTDTGTVSSETPDPDASPVSVLRSSVGRNTDPQASADMIAQLTGDNTAFACDLYQLLRDRQGNLFYSPHSISLALAMLYGGTGGNTASQMAAALHFTLPGEQIHTAFNYLDLELGTRGEGAMGVDDQPFRLRIANSVWGQAGYSFRQNYLDLLAVNYGAGMNLLDFMAAPEPARLAINAWVSDSTEGRIPNLLPMGSITVLTRMVLTNAIYFNASWDMQFEEALTAPGTFSTDMGAQVSADFMNQTAQYGYLSGTGFVAVELPYDGRELSMVVVMPDAGTFALFEQAFDRAAVSAICDGLTQMRVALSMPKFTIDGDGFSLKAALRELGMSDAFTPHTADLSGIDGTRELYVMDVVHKAFVAVDEKGTEAAAATAVIIGTTSLPPPPIPVVLDRPFLFFIRDVATGAVLFVGRVVNPV